MRLLAGTEWDRPPTCDRCGQPEPCSCPPRVEAPPRVAPERQTARLAVEKRKQGRLVTVVRGLKSADNDFAALLTALKTLCGAGGAIDGDTLELQGDHATRITEWLKRQGYRVR